MWVLSKVFVKRFVDNIRSLTGFMNTMLPIVLFLSTGVPRMYTLYVDFQTLTSWMGKVRKCQEKGTHNSTIQGGRVGHYI